MDYEENAFGYKNGEKSYEYGQGHPATCWHIVPKGSAAGTGPPPNAPPQTNPRVPQYRPNKYGRQGADYESSLLDYDMGEKSYEQGQGHPATCWHIVP